MNRTRVNIRTRVANASIRREERNGREVLVVPSATLPDNIVMQRILYPADEIEKSFRGLERTPAPLGHPMIGNKFISANEPEAINGHWVGAWNENVRRENGRVFLDKIVDVEYAQRTEQGKSLLEAINSGEPIHTSTGLLLVKEAAPGSAEDFDWIARDMVFDHDAILMNTRGAATPEQGVGMLVNNSDGSREEIPSINADIPDDAISFAAEIATDVISEGMERARHEKQREGMRSRLMEVFRSLFDSTTADDGDGQMVSNVEGMKMDEETRKAFDELREMQTNAAESMKKAVEEVVKPLAEKVESLTAANEEREKAERADLIGKVVNTGLFDEKEAGEMTTNALRKLSERIAPGKSDVINGGGFDPSEKKDEWADYDLNKIMEKEGA